jgi:hypothetical protein
MELPVTSSVTDYHFTWCNAVINVMFNPVKPLSIISERTAKNKQLLWENNRCGKVICFQLFWGKLYGNVHCRADFSLKLQIIKVFEIIR